MGLFGKVFGGKKKQSVEVSLGEAGQFLERELSQGKKRLLDDSAKRLAEIRHLLMESEKALSELESARGTKRSGRLDRIVETAKSNALRQLSSLLEKLKAPNTQDLAAIRDYASESLAALQQSGAFGKNVAYAGISFRDEMKVLGQNMKQLSQAFLALKKLMDENSRVFLQAPLKERLLSIEKMRSSSTALEEKAALLESAISTVFEKRAGAKAGLERLSSSAEFKALSGLRERKSSLLREKQTAKTSLLDLFSRIEKPLHRLDKASNAGKVFLSRRDASFLHALLQNPFHALKLDPKAETLKSVLTETKRAVESGHIELKDKERAKKLEVLDELISFDFFGESFWKFNKIDSEMLQIEKQLSGAKVTAEEERLESFEKALEAEQNAKTNALAEAKSAIERNASETKALLAEAKGILCRATGKEVRLRA